MQDLGNFVHRQSAEKPQVDDSSQLRVKRLQLVQCVIQCDEMAIELGWGVPGNIERQSLSIPASFN